MERNDVVVITWVEESNTDYMKVGDRALLKTQNKYFTLINADFTVNEEFYESGQWAIQKGFAEYELVTTRKEILNRNFEGIV